MRRDRLVVARVHDRLAGAILEQPHLAHPGGVEGRVDATDVRQVALEGLLGRLLHHRVAGVAIVREVDDVVAAVALGRHEVGLLHRHDERAVVVGHRQPVRRRQRAVERQHQHRRPLVLDGVEQVRVVTFDLRRQAAKRVRGDGGDHGVGALHAFAVRPIAAVVRKLHARRAAIFADDPFQSLDVEGVGRLVEMACAGGRRTRKNLKLGICGEHGGDPKSVYFCHWIGLDYVSCSPYRVPIARLAAAQAVIIMNADSERATRTATPTVARAKAKAPTGKKAAPKAKKAAAKKAKAKKTAAKAVKKTKSTKKTKSAKSKKPAPKAAKKKSKTATKKAKKSPTRKKTKKAAGKKGKKKR
ncbi:MAG: hypothetical protein IIC02_10995 [Planctomycetes bacterium]|nr:hypothetical protein [Planctomycetota bacterium]